MNGGQALSTVDGSGEEERLSFPEADSPVPASAMRARREEASTLPSSDPFRARLGARADWCVDVGEALLTMSTFELWAALEDREVLPSMRVWREGMECWTPVRDMPELRWAAANDGSAATPPPEAVAAEAGAEGALHHAQEAATPAPEGLSTAPEAATPAPETARAAEAASRPPVGSASPARAPGARWLFGGSAVAALAVGLALLHGPVGAPMREAAGSEVAASEVAEAPAAATPAVRRSSAGGAQPATVEGPAHALVVDRPAPAQRRADRGQRRLSRGGRRAQGR